ncbi:hypothetical protein Tco_1421749 [Tanacetum coccineum]
MKFMYVAKAKRILMASILATGAKIKSANRHLLVEAAVSLAAMLLVSMPSGTNSSIIGSGGPSTSLVRGLSCSFRVVTSGT